MQVTGKTHIGLVRNSNQDALAFGPLGELAQYAVVCDGMGGANGGNVASEIAIRILSERITGQLAIGQTVHSMEHLLSSAMAAANAAIFTKAQEDPELSGMGTTVVAVIQEGHTAYISHVGDSRLYHLHDGVMRPVTRDHSVVQNMIEQGQITEEQARSHPRRHFITRALGVSAEENGEYDELELEAGDRLLLCSDGLINMVDTNEVARRMAAGPPEEAAEALIQAALDGGGTDNITVVILDITE